MASSSLLEETLEWVDSTIEEGQREHHNVNT